MAEYFYSCHPTPVAIFRKEEMTMYITTDKGSVRTWHKYSAYRNKSFSYTLWF